MKKLNSFEDLGALLSEEFMTKKKSENENVLTKQNLEVIEIKKVFKIFYNYKNGTE